MSLVLLRGKADSAHNNPFFMTSPSEFTTFEFPISNYFNFQILLEVIVIQRKNCQDGSRHSPSLDRYGFANQLQFVFALVKHCHAYPWGGGFCWGGMGRVESMKWWWCGDEDEMISFLHSFYKRNFLSIWGEDTEDCFTLLCCAIFAFAPVLLHGHCIWLFASLSLKTRQAKEKFRQAWTLWQKILALHENFGALQKFWRFTKILALHENFGALQKFRRFTKILADLKNCCVKPLRLTKI